MEFLSGRELLQVYSAFRQTYIEHDRGLTVGEFAHAIAQALPSDAVAKLGESSIASQVLALFTAVDVNGDVSAHDSGFANAIKFVST